MLMLKVVQINEGLFFRAGAGVFGICVLKMFLFKLIFFYIFILFWFIDVKNNFFLKKIILICFKIKNQTQQHY